MSSDQIPSSNFMQQETMNANEPLSGTDEDVYPSAYTAPAHIRPQAEPNHSVRGRQEQRGDLTADNLERIPDADHVAPGIRLQASGNDAEVGDDHWQGETAPTARQEPESVDRIKIDGRGRLDADSENQNRTKPEVNIVVGDGGNDMMLLDSDRNGDSFISGRAPSSMDYSGRSSTGAIDHEGSEGQNYRHDDGVEEDMVDFDDDDDEQEDDDDEKDLVHERVGGSGATAENASKGTSVGHFGPRGEAIPGVPPHLDPRQPHFRPPSPSAASVLSVAVQPPASPKLQASAGSGLASVGSTSVGSALAEVVDSGEETESFDNGALTPTLSDEFPEDDTEERLKLPSDPFYNSNSKPGPSFNLQRMNLDSEDASPSTSSGGPYQVSFNPIVTSHHRGSLSGYSGRAPSIAATAGSSRAPSTRGMSPTASMFRTGTTEGSSVEEFESTGTGLDGDAGAETPSVGRSRRSSYSAPSSEVDNGVLGDDVNNRARGSTLVPSMHASGSNANLNAGIGQGQSDLGEDGGPSLAPSEAGSDSTRSMTYESSLGHGPNQTISAYGGVPLGHATASSERLPLAWASAGVASSSPVVLEPPSIDRNEALNADAGFASASGLKGSSNTPMLPSLLAIKRASRRQDSGPASTAATAGTTSPASSLSVDGDFDESQGNYVGEMM